MNNRLSNYNSMMIAAYTKFDPRVKALILLIKKWAKSNRIQGADKGYLSSYGYTILCLYFCMNPVTPPKPPYCYPTFENVLFETGNDNNYNSTFTSRSASRGSTP